jgi:hypothetical protein
VVEMSNIKKGIAAFIVFLSLVLIYELWQIPIINILTHASESKVTGFLIQFEDGTTEPEIKSIIENCNLTLNYSIDYKTDYGSFKYYLKVYKDNLPDAVGNVLIKDENWTYGGPPPYYFEKGNYCIVPVTEEATQDENFIALLGKNNLQVKRFVSCSISYKDNSSRFDILGKNCITRKDAIRISNELEMNDKILILEPLSPCY